jgi:hypothetical protein
MLSLVLLSLGTFFLLDLIFVEEVGFFTGQGISTLIRYSNPSIPAYLLMAPLVYEKINRNKKAILAAALILLTAVSFTQYTTLVQTNLSLPYNAMSFGHEFGPMVARDYFLNETRSTNATAFISNDWKAGQLYLADIPNLNVHPTYLDPLPVTEKQFEQMHLTTYYILSAGALNPSNMSQTIASLGLQNPPPYISGAYDLLYNRTPPSVDGYTITSSHTVFSNPTGHMIKVTVSWA